MLDRTASWRGFSRSRADRSLGGSHHHFGISVSVTIDRNEHLEKRSGSKDIATTDVRPDQAILAVVGREAMSDAGVVATTLEALRGIPITMLSLGTSGLNLSIVLEQAAAERAVRSVHQALFERPSEEAA